MYVQWFCYLFKSMHGLHVFWKVKFMLGILLGYNLYCDFLDKYTNIQFFAEFSV